MKKNWFVVIFSFGFALILSEILLLILGFNPDFEEPAVYNKLPPLASWWICDNKKGCRFDKEHVEEHFEYDRSLMKDYPKSIRTAGKWERLKIVNSRGFHDQDEFIDSDNLKNATNKILVLGDSFTFGATAKIGN